MGKRARRKSGASIPPFLTLQHWMLDSPAFLALSPIGAKLLIRLSRRYNGFNNGEVSMSVREAENEVGCARNTAVKAFRELQEKGFVSLTRAGAFATKARHASTWRLTWLPNRPHGDSNFTDPDKLFMRWVPGRTMAA